MKLKTLVILFLLSFGLNSYSQIGYYGKVETGYLKYFFSPILIDPGPGWKGYYLDTEQNAVSLNVINGFNIKHILFTGIGLGYLNFEGISGVSVFADVQFEPLKTKLSPLLNTKIGYNHIWNQYENGRGTLMGEFGLGLRYKLNDKYSIYTQGGFLFCLQSVIIPVRIGLSF